MTTPLIRHLPNLISFARILSVPVLVVLAIRGQEEPFKWLLLAVLLSDILDGLLALASVSGATLDSIGDSLLMAAACGVWVFHPGFVPEHGATVLFVGLWVPELLVSFWRYGNLSSCPYRIP